MTIPRMLRDVDGNIIPQIWDGTNWVPYAGQLAPGTTIDVANRAERELGRASLNGPVEITDRTTRELGTVQIKTGSQVGVSGTVDIASRSGRELGVALVKGKYGTKEIPIRVDAEGRLVLASAVTVDAQGLVVELGQIQQGPPGGEPWPVLLADGGPAAVRAAPATGTKTVTGIVAEVFAGSSRKPDRRQMIVRNLHHAIAIRIGGASISDTIGQLLEPGASVEVNFHPNQAVPIYVVSTAGNVPVEVIEV